MISNSIFIHDVTSLSATSHGDDLSNVVTLRLYQSCGYSHSKGKSQVKLFFSDDEKGAELAAKFLRAIEGMHGPTGVDEIDITETYADFVGWSEDREINVTARIDHEPCELDGATPDGFTEPGVEAKVLGITITEEGCAPMFFDRAQTLALMGKVGVDLIEKIETDALQGN